MVTISVFKRARGGKEQIDIQEAFNIYNLLRARYVSLQTAQIFRNFAHDRDLAIVLDTLIKHFNEQFKALEEQGKKFAVVMPEKPPLETRFATSLNEITDEYIFKKIYFDMVAQLLSLTHATRSSTTNDGLREIIIQDLRTHIKDIEGLYKYGKLKGWEDTFPAYKTAQPVDNELLSTAEAYHLWDHISQRYDQLELTTFAVGFIHDPDFQILLQRGLNVLSGQVSMLEQEAMKYNVMLPNRPPASMKGPIDPESMTDRFLYGMILPGILSAVELHMRAVLETIRNDSLRKIWLDLLEEELKIYDRFIKYGKLKGWLRVVPVYGEPIT